MVVALAGSLSIGLLRRMNRPCWVPVRQFGRKFSEKEQGGVLGISISRRGIVSFLLSLFLVFFEGGHKGVCALHALLFFFSPLC